jgi:PIN domain nuclease of toxin-antitoxin system
MKAIRVEPFLPEDVEDARGIAAVAEPFDRLLAATALRLSAPLISKDARLKRLRGLRTLW